MTHATDGARSPEAAAYCPYTAVSTEELLARWSDVTARVGSSFRRCMRSSLITLRTVPHKWISHCPDAFRFRMLRSLGNRRRHKKVAYDRSSAGLLRPENRYRIFCWQSDKAAIAQTQSLPRYLEGPLEQASGGTPLPLQISTGIPSSWPLLHGIGRVPSPAMRSNCSWIRKRSPQVFHQGK